MSTVKGLRAVAMASILVGVGLVAGAASAQGFSTERPGSILIFPKVINDDQDTRIQITNTTNSVVQAHCFYTNGATFNGEALWQVTDFDLVLTRQQPTTWVAGDGRPVNPTDGQAGLDPGLIPPVPDGFTGYLLCVQVDPGGAPVGGNAMIGTASVLDEENALAGQYNAVAIAACNGAQGVCGPGGGDIDDDNVLGLDNVEYAACPGGSYLNFVSEGLGEDPVLSGLGNGPGTVSTNLTMVPCGADFENLEPVSTTLNGQVRDEFELRTSLSQFDVDCFFEASLDDPGIFFGRFSLPTTFGSAIITPLSAPGNVPALGVATALWTAADGTADTATTNLHFCTDEDADCTTVSSEIRLPNFR
jgi:hypothetical protein